jgi:hypothetical protein
MDCFAALAMTDSVRRGLSILSLTSLEYWITRFREGFAEVGELVGRDQMSGLAP